MFGEGREGSTKYEANDYAHSWVSLLAQFPYATAGASLLPPIIAPIFTADALALQSFPLLRAERTLVHGGLACGMGTGYNWHLEYWTAVSLVGCAGEDWCRLVNGRPVELLYGGG